MGLSEPDSQAPATLPDVRLGHLVEEARAKSMSIGAIAGKLTAAAALLVVGFVLLGVGAWGLTGADVGKSLVMVLFGLPLVLGGLLMPIHLEGKAKLARLGVRAALYREGLVYMVGPLTETYRWADVEEVWWEKSEGFWGRFFETSHIIHLKRRDGKQVTLTDALGAEEMWGFIIDANKSKLNLAKCKRG